MTLLLPATDPSPVQSVRCANPLCRRWLYDPESVARRFGRSCAEELGLIPPRRHRFAVVSGAADMTLFEINEGDGSMGYNVCDHGYAPRFGGPRPRIVTLCGSTRFKTEFEQAERDETLAGRIVLTVGLFGHDEGLDMGSDDQPAAVKVALDKLHKRKIDMCDEILVVTDHTRYVGTSTREEIAYAQAAGKRIRYLVDGQAPVEFGTMEIVSEGSAS